LVTRAASMFTFALAMMSTCELIQASRHHTAQQPKRATACAAQSASGSGHDAAAGMLD